MSDLDRSVAFYRDLFGFTVERVSESSGTDVSGMTGLPGSHFKLALSQHSGHLLELIQYLSPRGTSKAPSRNDVGAAHIAFYVDDAQETYRILHAHGVRFVTPPQDRGAVIACYFLDPDGITLEFACWVKEFTTSDTQTAPKTASDRRPRAQVVR